MATNIMIDPPPASHLTELTRYVTGWISSTRVGHFSMHTHPTLEIVYHAAGQGRSKTTDHQPIYFQPGSVTIYPANIPHDQTMKSDGQDCCIHLQFSNSLEQCFPATLHLRRVSDTYIHRELRDLAVASTPHTETDATCLNHRAHALLVRLLALAYVETTEDTSHAAYKYAEKAYHYIAREFQTIGNLTEVSDHVGVSHDYLRHLFRKRYGLSLKQLLTQSRIDHAKNLLRYSSLPAQSIGELCGYATARHFSSTFQKQVGTSPIAYRRAQRHV